MSEQIDYNVSLYPSKFAARHKTIAKNCPNPEIIIYISTVTDSIEEYIQKNFVFTKDIRENVFFHYFKLDFIFLTILERVCLECRLNNKTRIERGLGKKRIRGRCKEFNGFCCKMEYVTDKIINQI